MAVCHSENESLSWSIWDWQWQIKLHSWRN